MRSKTEAELWPLKAHYFLHGFGGVVAPFLPVITKQMGVNGAGLGVILGIIPVLGLVIKPILGGVMDKYNLKKPLFLLVILLSTLAFSLIQYLPSIETTAQSMDVKCDKTVPVFVLAEKTDPCVVTNLHSAYDKDIECSYECSSAANAESLRSNPDVKFREDGSFVFKASFRGNSAYMDKSILHIPLRKAPCVDDMKCYANCTDQALRKVLNANVGKNHSDIFKYTNYWLILYVWVVGSLCMTLVATFQDAICHQILGDDGDQKFGSQRLWGSVGWGMAALTAGYLVDKASEGQLLYDYTTVYRVLFVCWTLDLILCYLKLQVPSTLTNASRRPFHAVGSLLKNPGVVLYFFYTASCGFCFGALSIQFLLLEELGNRNDCNGVKALKFLQGLCLTLNTMGEVPIFHLSGKIIKRFGSKIVMHLVLLVFCARYFYYSCMESPWDTVFVEIIHGISVGLFYPVIVTFANQVAPPGAATTMTASAYAVFDIGMALGCWTAGGMFQDYGGSATYRFFSLCAAFALVVHAIGQRLLTGWRKGEISTPRGLSLP